MTEEQARELGWLVKQARLAHKLSLRKVEQRTQVSYRWIARLESGELRRPAMSKLRKVVDLLDLPVDHIDGLTPGQFADDLPPLRPYFRTKYQLTDEEIRQIEDVFEQIRHDRLNQPGGELSD